MREEFGVRDEVEGVVRWRPLGFSWFFGVRGCGGSVGVDCDDE